MKPPVTTLSRPPRRPAPMCPRRTWIAGAALLAAVVLGACSGGTGGVSVGSGGRDELFAETASFEVIAAKPQRIMVGLSTKDGRVVHGGTVRLTLRPAAGGGAALRVTAVYLPVQQATPAPTTATLGRPSEGIGVFGGTLTFPTAGFWTIEVETRLAGGTRRSDAAVEVLASRRVPDVGEDAPRTRNPVLSTPGVKPEQIDSLGAPFFDEALHHDVIADAIAAKHPVVVVVSTPAFCKSRFCGPVTSAVNDLALAGAVAHSDVAYVHLEVWRDFATQTVNRSAAEWILPNGAEGNEPWVFVVGRNGRIIARFDNVVPLDQLKKAIAVASR